MLNSSRQSESNSDARNVYGSYNVNNMSMGNGSNYYSGVVPGIHGMGGQSAYGHYGNQSNLDKSYSIIIAEPALSRSNQPLIIVDPPVEPYVKSYLLWSVLNIIFCCVLGGIVTTVMSVNVMRLNDNKEYKEAYHESGKVLKGNMIVTALGALIILIAFPYAYIAIYPSLPKINW